MFDFTKEREAFENKVWLSSPTMHGPELEYIKEAYETNWMSSLFGINAKSDCTTSIRKADGTIW